MTILSPISWAKSNVGALIGAAVGGVVFLLTSALKFQYALGLNFALAYLAARWAEVAYTAMTAPTVTPAPPVTASNR